MKRFHYALKTAVMMVAIFTASFASAQLQRLPDPGPAKPSAEQIAKQQNRENFFRFVKELQAHNPATQLDAPASSAQMPLRQRPEKILRTPWDPEGNIYATVPNFNGITSYGDAYYGKFDVLSGTLSRIWRSSTLTNGDEAYLQSGFVRDNILYIPQMTYDEIGMVTHEAKIIWKRFDISTGRTLSALDFGSGDDAFTMFTYGMTYDPIHDVVYGLSYDNVSGLGGGLMMVDCSKPVEQWVGVPLFNVGGSVNNWMAGICYNPETDTLYGLKSQGALCEIDLESQGILTVYEYDDFMEDFCFPPVMQSTPMCYSPHDKAMLFIYGSTNAYFSICSIDAESYEAIELSSITPAAMFGNLYCADEYAKDEAPALMQAPVLNFKNADTKGTYSFTAPVTYYNGIKLDKDIVMHVLVDDEEIFSSTVAPGQTVTNEVELSEGLHFIKGYCSIGDLNGPTSSKRIYIGNDQPYAPTGLSYIGGVLTWKTPSSTGVNNAYLDLSNVTYDVYIDGVKHNSTPIKGNSYSMTFDEPANGRKAITVTATANGQTSDPSQALSRVLGKGYELPLTIAPTAAEATLFEKLNVNKDAYEWTYFTASNQPPCWTIHTQEYTEKPNDWLFLPPMYFDNAADVYNLIVTYVNARQNNIQKDNTEIWIGKDPIPSAMTKMIYSHEGRIQSVETDLEVSFAVPEAGTYFIGFYAKPGNENLYRGINLRNFRISKSKGSNTSAPGELTEVTLTPAEYGELFVTVEATIPTMDMAGNPLSADEDVTLAIYTEASAANPTILTGKPGEKVKTLLAVDVDGFSDVFIIPSNEHGIGSRQVFTAYTGYDNPLPPTLTGIHISEDNLALTVSWEAVGSVGEHGGYVDPSEVTYDIYTQSTAGSSRIGTAGKDLSYTYKIGNALQNYYYFGPVATNSIGISTNGQFVSETLGRLYNTPVMEEWGYSAFTLQKWMTNTVAPYKNVRWEHMTEPDQLSGDGITFIQGGALRAVNESGAKNWGELQAPRISTANDPKVGMTLHYWNNSHSGHMELWGRTYENQEFRKIAELDPSRPAEGQWADWNVVLPEDFCEQAWIQVNVRAHISSNETVIIDSYKIQQLIENDFQLTTLTGPYSSFVGDDATFDIVVTNNGTENGRGKLTLELQGDNTTLETQVVDIERIRSGEEFLHSAHFTMLEEYFTDYDFLTLYATAEADGDENSRNNTKYYEVLLYDSPLPIVRDLTANRGENGSDVNLNWSMPDNKEKGLESAELYPAMTLDETFGPWTVSDIDGMEPFVISNKRWQGDSQPAAWVVWDAKEMNTMDEARLCPRSGDKMFLARSIAYDSSSEAPTRAMDFLISPEVKGGTKVSFWMNNLDSQYAETIAIFYSSTDMTLNPEDVDLKSRDTAPRKCGSFNWLCNFTKSGAETWEQLEFTLPEDAKYFAFVYSSFGMFGTMIDDIVYTPATPAMIDIDSYEILVAYPEENPKTLVKETKTTSFTHASTDSREATYYVKTNVISGDRILQSPLSNPAKVVANGIEGLEAGQFVSAGKGKIVIGGAAGKNVTICDAAGRVLSKSNISYDPQSFAMEAGIYLVKLGEATVKVIVK